MPQLFSCIVLKEVSFKESYSSTFLPQLFSIQPEFIIVEGIFYFTEEKQGFIAFTDCSRPNAAISLQTHKNTMPVQDASPQLTRVERTPFSKVRTDPHCKWRTSLSQVLNEITG